MKYVIDIKDKSSNISQKTSSKNSCSYSRTFSKTKC